MEQKKIHTMSDEALLQSFFAGHAEHIEDAGFTQRVLAALPEGAMQAGGLRLRRWSVGLNAAAAVGIVVVLVMSDAFGVVRAGLMATASRLVATAMAFDTDTLLVQAMLFLHRLPALLPTPQQALAVVLVLLAFTVLGVQEAVHRRSISLR